MGTAKLRSAGNAHSVSLFQLRGKRLIFRHRAHGAQKQFHKFLRNVGAGVPENRHPCSHILQSVKFACRCRAAVFYDDFYGGYGVIQSGIDQLALLRGGL